MASARNLCQHSDNDGNQCTSNDYIFCPHCQLQLCLEHLNFHQELLRSELYNLCNDIDCVRVDLNNLTFDANNYREHLFKQLDEWYKFQIDLANKIYNEKKQQIQILYLQSRFEFDTYRSKQEKHLKDNLTKQLSKVLKQKQVNIDDLNEMKTKLDYIQRGLNELKQLNIDIYFNNSTYDINVVKKRYIEAAKPLFADDDNNIWETDNEDEEQLQEDTDTNKKPSSSDDHQITENSQSNQENPPIDDLESLNLPPSNINMRKPPLKLIIKRLQHPTVPTAIKYKLSSVNTSLSVTT